MDTTDRDRRGGELSRRTMIEATAAALAAPLLKVRVSALGSAELAAAPRFLTGKEFALLDALTELIIPTDDQSPGAHAAGVTIYLDGRLADSLQPEWQAAWRSGLAAVEQLSTEMNGKAFLDATAEQRVAVMTRMAVGEGDPKTPPEHFFTELKHWTVNAYYTSKIGIHTDQQYKGNVYQTGEYAGYDAR
jgi:hypothetical protein